MKILHTSDWHLDHTLYRRRRTDEFCAFLKWINQAICEKDVDILIISGDIFNTQTPSVSAQEMYYDFLRRVREDYVQRKSRCRHVVIVAGNHDSPAFLAAPKEILRFLNVYVVSKANSPEDAENRESISDAVLFLKNHENKEGIIVTAIPFLPAKDVATSQDGETAEDKSKSLNSGIREYYAEMLAEAEAVRERNAGFQEGRIPIIATGHLFTQGGKTGLETEDGVINGFRELYVGNLEHFPADGFPNGYDYVALGHLHVPQQAGRFSHIRYSGSPLPIGFSEAGQQKEVLLVEFSGNDGREIERLPVPCFQALCQVQGELEEIETEIMKMKNAGARAWVEITYKGTVFVPDLQQKIDAWVKDSELEVLSVRNRVVKEGMQGIFHPEESLEALDEENVFRRRLVHGGVPESDFEGFLEMFREILEKCKE